MVPSPVFLLVSLLHIVNTAVGSGNICLYTSSVSAKSVLVEIADKSEFELRYTSIDTHFPVSPALKRITSDREGRQTGEFLYHHFTIKAQNTEVT